MIAFTENESVAKTLNRLERMTSSPHSKSHPEGMAFIIRGFLSGFIKIRASLLEAFPSGLARRCTSLFVAH